VTVSKASFAETEDLTVCPPAPAGIRARGKPGEIMARPDDQATHSGFARFPDRPSHERFIKAFLEGKPELMSRAYLSESRPTIVFENLTDRERDEIISALAGIGRWFDDVQFQTTS
jgi:hypothetical protein